MQKVKRSFFSSPSVTGLVQQLKHLCVFGADVLVVQGDVGSGKTTLYQYLSEDLTHSSTSDTPLRVSTLGLECSASSESMLASLCDAIGLPRQENSSRGELLTQLRSYSQYLIKENSLSIVLVDNAHCISNELLAALLSLLQGAEQHSVGLRFVFFSLPGLVERLDATDLLDVAVYDFQMPAYSSSELERFLSHCFPDLKAWIEDEKIPPISSLWQRSKGNPGMAIDIVNASLKDTSEPTVASDIKKMPAMHIAALAVLFGALLMVFFYGGDDDADNVASVAPPMLPDIVERNKVNVQHSTSEGADATGFATANASRADKDMELANANAPTEFQVSSGVAKETASMNDVKESGVNDNPSLASTAVKPQASANPVSETIRTNPGVGQSLTADEQRLMSVDDGKYMLQLVAASNGDTLKSFVLEQVNNDKLYVYRKRRPSGANWFVVVLGPYASSAAAQGAIASLPDNQKRAGPWPKRVATIKQDIETFRVN